MKAAPDQQHLLLDLQQIDTALAQLRHRTVTKPLADQVSGLSDQLALLRRQIVEAQTGGDDLQRAVNKSEDELERVRKRLQRDREMAGEGASARVQRDLEHELTSLVRRVSDLEDAELEMLARQEELTGTVARLREQEVQLRARLEESRTQQESDVAQDSARGSELKRQREAIATRIGPALLSHYEAIRADTPVAAAQLLGNQCGGCRLQLPPVEVTQLLTAPGDEVLNCDECGCILVRE